MQKGRYQLGTEAALQPHLRTIVILKKGATLVFFSAGNRILLLNIDSIPFSELLLTPASDTVNGRPVLLFQTHFATRRIIVNVSDSHIRDALSTPLEHVNYALVVGGYALDASGNFTITHRQETQAGQAWSGNYPYSVRYNLPPLFSVQRLIEQGAGIMLFLLLMSATATYVLHNYLNKNTLPEESLRTAIARWEIVPFYQPVVNGREGTLRGVEVLARWKHPQAGYISRPHSFPLPKNRG
jgi:hypothetical protein